MMIDSNRQLRFPRTLTEAGWSSYWQAKAEVSTWLILTWAGAGAFVMYVFLALALGWSPK